MLLQLHQQKPPAHLCLLQHPAAAVVVLAVPLLLLLQVAGHQMLAAALLLLLLVVARLQWVHQPCCLRPAWWPQVGPLPCPHWLLGALATAAG